MFWYHGHLLAKIGVILRLEGGRIMVMGSVEELLAYLVETKSRIGKVKRLQLYVSIWQ
jgi:hypothetical protein